MAVATAAGDFASPLDAAVSPDGCTVYFTAIDVASGSGAVYSVASTGGTAKALGTPSFGYPNALAVSSDGATLFVGDIGSNDDGGTIYSVDATSGAPTSVVSGVEPRGLQVAKVSGADTIFFTGTSGGVTGAFSVAGGTSTAVGAAGAAIEPGAIDVGADGTAFIIDDVAGAIIKDAATPAGIGGHIRVGFPSGLALSTDGTGLVASVIGATGTSSIVRVNVADGTLTTSTATGITGTEPGGLHRAANAEVYAFADAGGSVYLLTKSQ